MEKAMMFFAGLAGVEFGVILWLLAILYWTVNP